MEPDLRKYAAVNLMAAMTNQKDYGRDMDLYWAKRAVEMADALILALEQTEPYVLDEYEDNDPSEQKEWVDYDPDC